jgi:hypothetical protein
MNQLTILTTVGVVLLIIAVVGGRLLAPRSFFYLLVSWGLGAAGVIVLFVAGVVWRMLKV